MTGAAAFSPYRSSKQMLVLKTQAHTHLQAKAILWSADADTKWCKFAFTNTNTHTYQQMDTPTRYGRHVRRDFYRASLIAWHLHIHGIFTASQYYFHTSIFSQAELCTLLPRVRTILDVAAHVRTSLLILIACINKQPFTNPGSCLHWLALVPWHHMLIQQFAICYNTKHTW